MASPLIPIVRKVLKSGEVVYKRGYWRVSASAYRSQQWRIKGGKAGTVRKRDIQRETESAMRARWGAPPAGKQWTQIAKKYPERFEGYMDEIRDEFR